MECVTWLDLCGMVSLFLLLKCIYESGIRRRQTSTGSQSPSPRNNPAKINAFASQAAFLPLEIMTLPEAHYSQLRGYLTMAKCTPDNVIKAYHLRVVSAIRGGCFVRPMRVKLNAATKTKGKLWGIPVTMEEFPGTKCKKTRLFRSLENDGALVVAKTYSRPTGAPRNPVNSSRLSGNSSADQVVLVKSGGAVVGFAQDFIGDLLIAAAFCGVAALRPSKGRLPPCRLKRTHSIHSRSVDGLIATMETLSLSWKKIKHNRIRVGYFLSFPGDAVPNPVPSVQRALHEAIRTLHDRGYSVEEILPPEPSDFMVSFIREAIYSSKVTQESWLNSLLKFIPIPSFLKAFIPNRLLRIVLTFLISKAQHSKDAAVMREFSKTLLRGWRNREKPYDVVISPVSPYPALPLAAASSPHHLCPSPYVGLFSLTNNPMGVVPVTTVTLNDTRVALREAAAFSKMGDWTNARTHEWQRGATGLPVCLQVVGLPNTDETLLRVMLELEYK